MAASAVAPPLDLAQTQKVRSALDGLTPAQLQWVSGYVAGLAARNETLPSAIAETATDPSNTMTILYGSQTGNGRAIAEELKQSAVSRGFAVRLFSLADYRPANIKRETLISLVVSTHGEGDPPDDAELFHEFLLSGKAPPLDIPARRQEAERVHNFGRATIFRRPGRFPACGTPCRSCLPPDAIQAAGYR